METVTARRYREHLIGNYGSPPLTLVRGEGCRVWDENGRAYLDFGSGIAVSALGHGHPHWVKRVSEQAATLAHTSNLYRIPLQAELAEKLCHYTNGGKWLFCNSGTEANEALIKLARLHGARLAGKEGVRYQVVTAENAFHGRTFGGMSATPQAKIQKGFAPLLPGFPTALLNDIATFEAVMDETVAAVLIEPIQGEGGIHVANASFLKDLRALCSEREVMLMIDEVQCGTGRSGEFFAHEHAGIRPDAIGMAKGLGGGFPIGALWADDPYSELFTPGSHGTTFGGNPLACAAALAVLEVIERDKLLERARTLGNTLRIRLSQLVDKHSEILEGVRGLGLMLGLVLREEKAASLVSALRQSGLLVVPAGTRVIRFLPPLTVSENELDEAINHLDATLNHL